MTHLPIQFLLTHTMKKLEKVKSKSYDLLWMVSYFHVLLGKTGYPCFCPFLQYHLEEDSLSLILFVLSPVIYYVHSIKSMIIFFSSVNSDNPGKMA